MGEHFLNGQLWIQKAIHEYLENERMKRLLFQQKVLEIFVLYLFKI